MATQTAATTTTTAAPAPVSCQAQPRRRHVFTHEECVRGGKARAAMPDFRDACARGFERTLEAHPFFARRWLKKRLKAWNEAKRQQAHDEAVQRRALGREEETVE